MKEDLIKDNGIYNYDALDFLHALYEDYGDESIDMFLCDFPYTFKGKNRVTANKWDLPIDDKEFFDIAMKMLVTDGCIALTASQPFTSYLVMNHLDYFKYEWIWEQEVNRTIDNNKRVKATEKLFKWNGGVSDE